MTSLLLLPLSLVSAGQAWVINGDSLGYADLSTGYVEQGALELATYPNDLTLHGDYIYAVCSGADAQALQRIDPNTMEVEDLAIGTGYNCWSSIALDDGHLAVSAALADRVVIIDTVTFTVESEIEGVGPNPEGMCLLGDSLWVACGGWGTDDNLVVVDLAAGQPVDTVSVGVNCQSVAWDGTDELVVVCSGAYGSGEGSVSFVDPQTMQETESVYLGGFPSTIQIRGGSAYAGDGWGPGVYEVDVETHEVLHDSSDPLCPGGTGFALDGGGAFYVSDAVGGAVAVYDEDMGQLEEYAFAAPSAVAVFGTLTGVGGSGQQKPSRLWAAPCPAVATVRITGADPGEPVVVMDLAGRVVARKPSGPEGAATLSVSGLDSGVYLVRSGRSSTRLIVLEGR